MSTKLKPSPSLAFCQRCDCAIRQGQAGFDKGWHPTFEQCEQALRDAIEHHVACQVNLQTRLDRLERSVQ